MNERIREIHMQVQRESLNMRWNIGDSNRFAELIVRDCISSIELYKNNSVTKEIAAEGVYSYESGCVAGMDESILIIKKHFGVDE
jgi:hypothetical protein